MAALTAINLSPVVEAHPGHDIDLAPWEAATQWPDRIIANPGIDPATSFSITWRTDATISSAIAEIVEANGDSRFDLMATPRGARYEQVDLSAVTTAFDRPGDPNYGRGVVNYHSVTFDNLKPDTIYEWRVRGAPGKWSEWFQTRTAPTSGPLTFLYFGDAQYGIRSHVSRIFRRAALTAGEIDAVIHAGDLVNKGERDTEWAEWFDAGDFIHAMFPVIAVAGNHEYLSTPQGGAKDGGARISDFWRPHFTLPLTPELPIELQETVYDLRYGDNVHIFVLDSSSPQWDAQMDWLVAKATASDATWKIVTLHHSPFRPGLQGYARAPERGDFHRARRDAFVEAAEKAGIDLILAGHNHSYTRASVGEDVGPGLPSPEAERNLSTPRLVDTVVVVSITGAMSGGMTADRYAEGNAIFEDGIALERWANNTPTFQIIRVDGDTLSYESYLATGELYDAFDLIAGATTRNTLRNREIVQSQARNFETTGPYLDKNDLK